jgi:hypothetical protein
MQIKIDSNFDQLARKFAAQAKQVQFAAAVALTRTAQDVQREVPGELSRALDKPTPFTQRGTFVVPARRDRLESKVQFKDRQARYMALQIAGGIYRPGAGGIRLPGNVQLNSFGNIPRGLVKRLKAAAADGSLSTAVAKRIGATGNRRKGAAPVQLFYGQPTGKRWKDAPVGIWRRVPPATPGGKGKLIPVIVFEKKPAIYRARFNFAGLAQTTARRRFTPNFQTAFQNALATAK